MIYALPRVIFGILSPLGLLAMGILFIALSRKATKDNSELRKRCTEETDGVISRLEKTEVGHDIKKVQQNILWIAYVTYKAGGFSYEQPLNGHTYHFFSVGENVKVRYNPVNPQQMYVEKDNAAETIARYYLPAGIILIIVAILMLLMVNIIFILLSRI